jgi:DnaD/phage-associated family protein
VQVVKTSNGFAGFPAGKHPTTAVPNAFFAELLPAIDHLGELKVTLYALWALGRQRGAARCLRLEDLRRDRRLLEALAPRGQDALEALHDSLERAVARGTLLRVEPGGTGKQAIFFLNSPRGRAAAEGLRKGAWSPDEDAPVAGLDAERPNIFVLYEQNLGPLTPLIAETLREAEAAYPAGWIEDAVRIAVENNVRRWRYVQAILEDWQTKGRDEREDLRRPEAARRRYVEGDFADFIEH